MRNEPMRRNDLPEACFSILPSSGQLIIIQCGERGYYPSEWDTGNREENREIASSHNVRRGITDIQEAAMLAGSMFGWNTPGANPQWYLDNARYVNSNIIQGHIKDPIMSVYYPVSSFLLCYEIMGKQHFYLPMDKLPQELMSQRSQFIMLPCSNWMVQLPFCAKVAVTGMTGTPRTRSGSMMNCDLCTKRELHHPVRTRQLCSGGNGQSGMPHHRPRSRRQRGVRHGRVR